MSISEDVPFNAFDDGIILVNEEEEKYLNSCQLNGLCRMKA